MINNLKLYFFKYIDIMGLINDKIEEYLIQIEMLIAMKEKKGEQKNDKNETEEYNLFKSLKNRWVELKNKCIGVSCDNKQLLDKKYTHRRDAIIPTDISESDYELLLSKVVVDMCKENQKI